MPMACISIIRKKAPPLRPLLAACCIALAAASCPREQEPEEAPIQFEGRPLEPGEKVTFDFPADGAWHVTPYIVYADHRIQIDPIDRGLQVPDKIIEVRIGTLVQRASRVDDPFTVTRSGQIACRLQPQFVPGLTGSVQVEIGRVPD